MGMYGYIWVCMGIYGYIWVTQVNIIPQKDHSEKLDCLDLDAFHKTSLNWGGTSQLSRPGDKQVKQVEILVKTMMGKTLTINIATSDTIDCLKGKILEKKAYQ